MTLAETIARDIGNILDAVWDIRDGQVVPHTEDVALSNGAVRLQAAFLYSDLAHSTELARRFPNSMAAKIVRAFLASMSRLIRSNGGEIRSFDGDRVMGVFIGDGKNSAAAKCALQMNHVVTQLLRPKAEAKFSSLSSKGFTIRHCVGIHTGDVLVVRGGVRGHNDLVFVGSPPNLAAKLSDVRNPPYHSFITHHVYEKLNVASKYGRDEKNMWTHQELTLSGETWDCYKSSWRWEP